jgi:hypothetical protein
MLATTAIAAPSCLLVQPLDEVSSDSAGGGAGKAGSGTAPSAGKGGAGPAPSGGRGGAGPAPSGGKGGSGPAAAGGPPSGVDFSLFLGKWYIVGGTIATLCSDSETTTPTTTAATVGGADRFDLGTTSDLLWDADFDCPLYITVDDRTASADPNYPDQMCTIVAQSTNYPVEITYESFSFTVNANGTTATSSAVVGENVTDTDGNFIRTCAQDFEFKYSRTAPPSGT